VGTEAGGGSRILIFHDGATTLPLGEADHLDIAQYSSTQIHAAKIEEL